MGRWIAFDQQTAEMTRERLGGQEVLRADEQALAGEPPERVAIQWALGTSSMAAALVPAGEPGRVLLMKVQRPPATRLSTPPIEPKRTEASSGFRAGGFLGLIDEPVFEDEEQQKPKKKWWGRG
jgi:hypothetical protein